MQFFAQVVVDVAADPVERSAEASGTVVIPFPSCMKNVCLEFPAG